MVVLFTESSQVKKTHTAIGVVVDAKIAGQTLAVDMRTAEEARSHADLLVPFERVEADEASHKRLCQIVRALHLLVGIATKILCSFANVSI